MDAVSSPLRLVSIKRKCGDVSIHLIEGCGKTLTEINDTMPHTYIVWVHAQNMHNHIATQEMSVIRHPSV